MIQLRGGDNKWRKPSEAPDVDFAYPDEVNKPAPSGATTVFDKFVDNFFPRSDTDIAIVPSLEKWFRRYYIILKDDETTPRYITLIVRTEWIKMNRLADKERAQIPRSTELRTVISDPYFSDT